MKRYIEKDEEVIFQSEKFTLPNGVTGRIQIKECSYTVILNLNTDCYRNLKFNAYRKGLRVESTLAKRPKKRIDKTVSFSKDIEDYSQLTEDTIIAGDPHYSIKITVRLYDIARSDVKKYYDQAFAV